MFRSALLLVLVASPAVAQEPYVAPKGDGPVVELLDDGLDPLIPLLTNDGGGEAGTAAREDRDVFAGLAALRVTQIQKYFTRLPGWNYRVVEKPANPGEFRYLRFAWKKRGGTGVMIQFHDPKRSWVVRYVAGPNSVGWEAVPVADKAPPEWAVVTRDLFKDFGELTLTGIALTAMDGDGALFDHVLLGRSVADLDAATDAALGRAKPAKPLTEARRAAAWRDLTERDAAKATAALRAMLATAPDHVAFIREQLTAKPTDELTKRIDKLVADLDADDFDVREAASKALREIGSPAAEALEVAARTSASPEVVLRATTILKGAARGTPMAVLRSARSARILDKAGTPDAEKLLEEMARGAHGDVFAEDAKMVLRRRG